MQIVIDIPKVFYEALRKTDMIVSGQRSGKTLMSVIYSAVANGTPLPKGHGRLIDADKLEPRDISPEAWYSPMWGFELFDIEDAPTIIEADKESEEQE